MRRNIVLGGVGLALWLAVISATTPAHGLVVPIPLEDLVKRSSYIVIGKVTEWSRTIQTLRSFPIFSSPAIPIRSTLRLPSSSACRSRFFVKLEVYNILGQKVKTLARDNMEAGRHLLVWSGKDEKGEDVSSGLYFCRLKAGQRTSVGKMLLLR